MSLAVIVLCLASQSAGFAPTMNVNVGTAVSPLQKYTVDELQSYARKMFSGSIDVSGKGGHFELETISKAPGDIGGDTTAGRTPVE